MLDEWLQIKVQKRVWIWASWMLNGYLWGMSYICLWCIAILARSLDCVIH